MSRLSVVIRRFAGLIFPVVLLTSCMSPLTSADPKMPSPEVFPTVKPYVTAAPMPALPIPNNFHQSPSLDALTQKDTLPSVDMRLPIHPKVVRPVEQVGQYGGTWRMVIQPVADGEEFIRTVAYEPLVRWTSDWSGIESNLAETYAENANATQFTFKLRRGMRWSDGYPFTTQDIRFWYEKILLNTELTPVVPGWLQIHGQIAKFTFIDDLTFTVTFSSPNSLFLEQLATPDALVMTSFPAHYIQKFHKDYLSDDALAKLLAGGHYASWADMFIKQVGVNALDIGNFVDPARPRLTAWLLDKPYSINTGTVSWRRNPYYWKVDTAGNQLPYIDAVSFNIVNNVDEAINHAIAGEVDMQNLSEMGIDVAATINDLSQSEYRLTKLESGSNNVMVIGLNLTDTDQVKRDMFTNQNFRIGLSYAIDRQEIINFLFNGKGKPWQAAPLENSPFYDPDMGRQYTEYNLEKANMYLDKAGYPKDALGKRLRPDGLPISFAIEVLENDFQQIAMLNMVAKYWTAVGIDVQPKPEPLPIYLAIIRANQHDAAAYTGGATYFSDVMLNPSDYMPSSADSMWAIPWSNWYNRVPGYESNQPEPGARAALQSYDRVRSILDTQNQITLMKGVLVMARENFWTIGIASMQDAYGIVRQNFHNVPEGMPSAWIYPDPGPCNPEQFYIAR